MDNRKKRMNPLFKKILIGLAVVAVLGGAGIWYIFNEKFTDTTEVKADAIKKALELIHEFEKDNAAANKNYAEKIIVVNGMVSEVEGADTTVNIKMADTTSGSYIIFAFQQQHRNEAKAIKPGDSVSIKGSCSGGNYSKILETTYITFKRCVLNK
ncbi:MAG: hypothetical protein H7211_02350 [Aquabacterium sp.]|nr:hypothetical protein [Ferruginibacter sp.]